MTIRLRLLLLCICAGLSLTSWPVSVSAIHRLHSFASLSNADVQSQSQSSEQDISIGMGTDTSMSALAKAQTLAQHLDNTMFQHLMQQQLQNQQQQQVDAVYNEKRIGIEVELQNAPRVIVTVLPHQIDLMKDQFKAGGKYAGKQWLDAAVIPLRYGNTWLETVPDNDGTPYMKLTTDAERNMPSASARDFWKAPLMASTGITEQAAVYKLSTFCGLNAAMEIVTAPLPTSTAMDVHPNYVYTTQAMRLWIRTLRRFTYESANGGADGGRVTNIMKASAYSPAAQAGGDSKDVNIVTKYWSGPANMVIVSVRTVMEEFTRVLADDGMYFPGLDAYNWLPTSLADEPILNLRRDIFPFSHPDIFKGGPQAPFYGRYLVFKLGAAGGRDTDEEAEMKSTFGFAPQLNFGFPVSQFAAPFDDTMKYLQYPTTFPNSRNGEWPMTGYIWSHVRRYGVILYDRALEADFHQHPRQQNIPGSIDGNSNLEAFEINDCKGFFVLFMHYYFIRGFLGLNSKFAHSLLLKSPLNDVLRSLSYRSRRVIASWWDKLKTVSVVFNKMEEASNLIWEESKIEQHGYKKPEWYVNFLTDRTEGAKEFLNDVLLSIDTDKDGVIDGTRWRGERARVIQTHLLKKDIITTPTQYGELDDGNAHPKPYPPGRTPVSPIAKVVPPFYITDSNGKRRPAVLMEHRDGNRISMHLGDIWELPPTVPKKIIDQKQGYIDALFHRFQSPVVLLEQQHMIRRLRARTAVGGDLLNPELQQPFHSMMC